MTTADSGTGSLRAVLAECAANDTVEPDPETFAVGSTVTILLASPITVAKRVRLKGAGRKIVLDGQGVCRCVIVNDGQALDAEDVAIVGGYTTANTGSALTLTGSPGVILTRSVVAGAYGYRPIYTSSNGGVLAISSVIAGNYATNAWPGCPLRGVGSTICGNYLNGTHSNSNAYGDGSIYNATPSGAGFRVAPPDTLAAEDWNADLWKQWDLSLTFESQYATTTADDWADADLWADGDGWRYDTLGLPRKANGASGAYELTDATIYWTGVDSDGDLVSSPSFDSADGWTTNPTIRAASERIPNAADVALIPRGDAFTGVFEGPTIILSGSDDFSGTLTDGHVDVGTFDFTGALNLAGSVYIDGDVAEIEVSIDGTLHVSQDTTVKELTLASGSSVVFDVDGVFLSATDAATVGTTTFSATTRAYFAAPVATDATAATFNNVVACDYGADVTAFSASGGVLSWNATDPTIGVLLEQQDGEDWTTLAERATSYTTRFPMKSAPVRLFDGEKFLTVDVGDYSCFWRITDWATFAASEKAWKANGWAVYLGGGDSDAYFSVKSWAIDPETSED